MIKSAHGSSCHGRHCATGKPRAVRQGLISSNPARRIELPRRESSTEYLAGDEAARLLTVAEAHARASGRAAHALVPILQAAACKPLSRGWHALRHTFASQFIMSGGNLVTLQKLLGHASIEMTLVYSHLAPDFVANEVERLKY